MENRPFEALINRFVGLEQIHGLYQEAQDELERHIATPICMANCGRCCKDNTILVWGIEVEYIASHLLGQGPLLDQVLDACEEWLRAKNGPIYSPKALQRNLPKLLERARQIYTGRCPLVDRENKCLIHMARPLVCRSYGVTTYPQGCPRPMGLGEAGTQRAYNRGMGEKITALFNEFLVEISEDKPLTAVGFLPAMLMQRLRAARFAGLVDSGTVDPVKLIRNYVTSPAILAEQQVFDLAMSGDKALQEVEKTGINTGPWSFVLN